MDDTVIAEVQKNPLEKLYISLREYLGHPFVEIRLYFLADDDDWHPTKKGVTFSPALYPEVMEALRKVQAHLAAESTPRRRRSPREAATG